MRNLYFRLLISNPKQKHLCLNNNITRLFVFRKKKNHNYDVYNRILFHFNFNDFFLFV